MRSIVLLLPVLALIGGCDRASSPQGQANEQGNVQTPAPDEVVAAPTTAPAPDKGVDLIGIVDRSHKGEVPPVATFSGPGNGAMTVGSFKGRPVLINLWATWCAPCVAEMPTLDALAAEGKVQVVTVSQDPKAGKVVGPFFAKAGFKALKEYLDPGLLMSAAYGNPSLPTSILYDSTGHEAWRMSGGMDWTTKSARDLLAEAK